MITEETQAVAAVTGASRGIGRACAAALGRAGYRLVLAARDFAGLEETAALCGGGGEGSEAILAAVDLEDPAGVEKLMSCISERAGRLDVLVNNAGCALSASVEDSISADWDRVMNLNAKAPFFLAQAALPLLRRAPHPVIVNIGSVVSIKGYEKQAIYTASKHALAGWTKSLAKEVAVDGIRVHLVAPGGVATDMVKRMRPDIDPSGLIRPEEIARAVVFLAESRGSAVVDVLEIHRASKEPFS